MKRVNSPFRKSKSITFKTATLIVIGLHVIAFIGLSQWGSFKASLAKAEWMKRKEQLLAAPKPTKWSNDHLAPKIVALPPKKATLPVQPPARQTNISTRALTELSKRGDELISKAKNIISDNDSAELFKKASATKREQSTYIPIQTNTNKRPTEEKPKKPNDVAVKKKQSTKKQIADTTPPTVIYSKQVTRHYDQHNPHVYETTEIIVDRRTIGSYIQGTASNGITLTPVY